MNLSVYFPLFVYFQPYPIKPTVDLYEPFCVLYFVTAQLGPRENMVMNSESIDFCGGLAAILFFQL